MKTMAVALLASALCAGPILAQTAPVRGGSNCMVEQAAQAALDREIKLIGSLATDVEKVFNGPEGCIDGSIFQEFDLSNLIPDLSGMLTSAATDMVTNAIASAKQKVCKNISAKITDAVGTAQGTVSQFSSGLTDDLKGVLDNGWEGLTL